MIVLEFVRNLVVMVWSFDGVKFIVLHVIVNVAVAIAAALKTRTFSLAKLGDFLISKLMPYVTVYLVVKLLGDQIGLAALAPLAWAVITATLLGDLGESLMQLGLNLPPAIQQLLVKDGGTSRPPKIMQS